MAWVINQERRKKICERVREIRIKRFGEGRGAQKEMARALGVPYTSYRGYEENRVNDDFLRIFAKKFGVQLLWLMAADDMAGPGDMKNISSAVVIDPVGKGVINSGQYIIHQMPDDSMEPTIIKGATVGVLPIRFGEPVPEKLVAVQLSKQGITIRRLIVHGNAFMVIPDNPHLPHDHIDIKKKDIIGQVVWQFSVI
jgi:hypothetical protein